jgi:isopenicillin-N epimerase
VRVVRLPFPIQAAEQVTAAITSMFTPQTRLLLVDHVTSPTGLVLPVQEIIAAAHAHHIRVLVDGAHAPGMLPLDLQKLNPDYYTANHHKWLCGPKVSGFLYVRRELQEEVRPTVISHAANRPRPGRSRFLAEFDWTGTFDPSPILALPTAIDFLKSLYSGGIDELMTHNRHQALGARDCLCDALGIGPPAPDEMIGSLVTIPLQVGTPPEQLGAWLYGEHRFELPVFRSPCDDTTLLRVALQAYNRAEQIERLAAALRSVS